MNLHLNYFQSVFKIFFFVFCVFFFFCFLPFAFSYVW